MAGAIPPPGLANVIPYIYTEITDEEIDPQFRQGCRTLLNDVDLLTLEGYSTTVNWKEVAQEIANENKRLNQ